MSGGCDAAWAGAVKCRSASPSNATKRPGSIGDATSGQPSKKVRQRGAQLACLDESGFRLLPPRRRTWAPKGHTPIVPDHDNQDRIAALAALTVSPKRQHLGLYRRFQPRHCQALAGADVLRALWRHLWGHVILLWDRGSMPRGPALEAICQAHPRVHLEAFPAYAPELNPAAQIWNDFKGHTANSLLRERRDLRRCLSANPRRVQRSQAKLRSFSRRSDRPSPP